MGTPEPLSITDAESIQNAILELVMQYPDYPAEFEISHETILWNNNSDDESIGLYSLPGAAYLKRYIYGGYKAQFYFCIRYRSSPECSYASIDSQLLLENIAKWLEKCAINFKDNKTVLESMSRTSQVYGSDQEVGRQDFVVNMRAVYEYEE